MALRRKGSAPWSLTKDAGLSDAPVSGSPFVEGDEIKPVIEAGYIDASGLWQIRPSDDLAFTFQDPSQALAAGADMEFNVDMLNHEVMILAVVDTSGNNINVDLLWSLPTAPIGPYAPFATLGINGSDQWKENKSGSSLDFILRDTSEALVATWTLYKIVGLRGTQGRIVIHNNDGANAGTISTAYLRLLGTPGGRP